MEERRAFVCATGAAEAVYDCSFDPATGVLRPRASTPIEKPMYAAVAPDERTLYTVNRVAGGEVTAFRIEERGLRRLHARPTGGEGACYVVVSPCGRCVVVANYAGGTVSSYRVGPDGRLGAGETIRHEAPGERDPHPHAARPSPDGRYLYVPDLGADRVVGYRADFERAVLDPDGAPDTPLPDGSGPRHIAFGPDGRRAFLVTELGAALVSLAYDPETGALDPVETRAMRSAGDAKSVAADVHVHPSGEWVYATLRGADEVVRFAVGDDGGLGDPVRTPTGGEWPRAFALSPDGDTLLTENNHSDAVVSFEVGPDGSLTRVSEATVPGPTCLTFVGRE